MMRVLVVDGDAASLGDRLETTSDAPKLGQGRGSLGTRKAGQLECRECGRRVAAVVLARDAELEVGRLELVAAHRVLGARQPAVEQLLDLRAGAERRMVVEVGVRDDGDP